MKDAFVPRQPIAKLTPLQDLAHLYSEYESTRNVIENGSEFASLPHFNGNKSQPIHNWFTYKEGFSSDLLSWVCRITGVELDSIENLLDPFVGVATSLLSAQLNYQGSQNLNLIGIERNPFIAFVAQTKLNWHLFDEKRISNYIPKLISKIKTRGNLEFDIANLSTLKNPKAFDENCLQDVMHAHNVIKNELDGTLEFSFFKLGWASIIETASKVRKDGRALRFVDKEARPPVYELLEAKWREMLADIQTTAKQRSQTKSGKITTKINEGDGRTLSTLNGTTKNFDLILYSPPYLNNLDYSEVYKMELWLSETITSQKEFRDLRLGTLRSHPSIKFPETDLLDNLPANGWARKLRDSLIETIPSDVYQKARIRTIRAYMDDMLSALRNQYIFCKKGARVICVVGNSAHGNKEHPIPIATDLLITSLAEIVGFELERLQITRYTRRRDNIKDAENIKKAQRETIIILRKPE